MKQELSYGNIQDALPEHAEFDSAAGIHGLLSGLLCMDAGIGCGVWLEHLTGAELIPFPQKDHALLERLFEETRRQLDEFDFSFELLLPDDDSPLRERTAALGEWCQGFLAGLGYGSGGAEWPGECTEILQDFVEITRIEPEASGEADETAYAELAEYVRVGVQVICSELQSGTPKQRH